jgi:hypothetical protein
LIRAEGLEEAAPRLFASNGLTRKRTSSTRYTLEVIIHGTEGDEGCHCGEGNEGCHCGEGDEDCHGTECDEAGKRGKGGLGKHDTRKISRGCER